MGLSKTAVAYHIRITRNALFVYFHPKLSRLNFPANPILVEVTRGGMVESVHRGAAAVFDAQGRQVAAFGDIERLIYPRSAIKPLQAIVFAESGALESFGFGDQQIALACASHSGESGHVDGVLGWLNRLGLDETVLECGAHFPAHRQSRITMARAGLKATSAHNNCSGKHAGFISVARHQGEPVAGYVKLNHPVQQRVLQVLQELTEEVLHDRPCGLDGCGIPVVGMSLRGIAQGFVQLAHRQFESNKRRIAAERICRAMAEHPWLVGGTDRFCSAVPLATSGRVLIKVGAEGVYAGMTTGANPLGLALKIDDGSRRAAEVAMGWLITKFCRLEQSEIDRIRPWTQPEVKTVANKLAGVVRISGDL